MKNMWARHASEVGPNHHLFHADHRRLYQLRLIFMILITTSLVFELLQCLHNWFSRRHRPKRHRRLYETLFDCWKKIKLFCFIINKIGPTSYQMTNNIMSHFIWYKTLDVPPHFTLLGYEVSCWILKIWNKVFFFFIKEKKNKTKKI